MHHDSLTAALPDVLSNALGDTIVGADYRTEQLHGGTLGDVQCVSGIAGTAGGAALPYRVVRKTQKKWERPGDPASWRREFDLAVSEDFGAVFSDREFRPPVCYKAAMNGDETEIWMEYIDGVSGGDLTGDMLEQAAEAVGRFQGRLLGEPEKLRSLSNLSDTGFLEREHAQWHTQTFDYAFLCSDQCRIPGHVRRMLRSNPWDNGKTIEFNYLRSAECGLPVRLKRMLIDTDDNSGALFGRLKRLPVVFCHRDFWIENIFSSNGSIVLIDWDGAGYGYPGEDIASLIADDTETDCLHDYFRSLIPAYRRGISPYLDLPDDWNTCVLELILLKFGYRILQRHMFSDSSDEKQETADRLRKIHELRDCL